ncbi:hypothetical protein STENM327S_08469 [Streptomyces tendae]
MFADLVVGEPGRVGDETAGDVVGRVGRRAAVSRPSASMT